MGKTKSPVTAKTKKARQLALVDAKTHNGYRAIVDGYDMNRRYRWREWLYGDDKYMWFQLRDIDADRVIALSMDDYAEAYASVWTHGYHVACKYYMIGVWVTEVERFDCDGKLHGAYETPQAFRNSIEALAWLDIDTFQKYAN